MTKEEQQQAELLTISREDVERLKSSDAKQIKMLFKKHKQLFWSYYKTANFKDPIIQLMRRTGKIDFYEKATKGRFEFKHTDGSDRFIILDTAKKYKFDYGTKEFTGYICHEDSALPLPEDPLLTSELFTIAQEKTLNDVKKWKAEELKAKALNIKAIGTVIAIAGGMYILYVMLKPNDPIPPPTQTTVIIRNITEQPAILGMIIPVTKELITKKLKEYANSVKRRGEEIIHMAKKGDQHTPKITWNGANTMRKTKRNTNKKIGLISLNNKSRKGTYVYVKEKGKKIAYYKYDPDVPLDIYQEYYTNTQIKKKKNTPSLHATKKAFKQKLRGEKTTRKGRTRAIRSAEQYIGKIKRKGTINQAIKKGSTYIKIDSHITTGQLKEQKKKLLSPLVLDKDLLEILITEENLKKIKYRLEYRISLKNRQGETIATTETFDKLPEETITRINEAIKDQEDINDKEKKYNIDKRLKNAGFNDLHLIKYGKVHKKEITIVFRKGRWKARKEGKTY